MSEMTLSHIRSLAGTVLVVLGIAVAVAGLGMSNVATAAEKRRWEPRVAAGMAALYLGCMVFLFSSSSGSWGSLVGPFLLVPAIALCAFLSANQTKYCDKCNATQPTGSWFEPQRFCAYCGAELDGKPARDDDLD